MSDRDVLIGARFSMSDRERGVTAVDRQAFGSARHDGRSIGRCCFACPRSAGYA